MGSLPKFHENPVAWVFIFGMGGFIAFVILASFMSIVDIPPDTTSRPLEQIFCLLIFTCAALVLLIFRDCGGPSWLVTSFFVSQIGCILVAFLGGYWWFSHSEQVGDPLLFANAFISLCWTYPFVEWFFISLRNGVEKKISAGFAGLWCIVCLIPLLSYFYVVAHRYADPKTQIAAIKTQRWEQQFEAALTEAKWRENAGDRRDEADRRALMEQQEEIRLKGRIHRWLWE